MRAAVEGGGGAVGCFGLDAEHVRTPEHRHVEVRHQQADQAIVALLRSKVHRWLEINSLRAKPCRRLRQALRQPSDIGPRRPGRFELEVRIVRKVQPVDHLPGDGARLQDETFVLQPLGARLGLAEDRLDFEHARCRGADQQAGLGDIQRWYGPCHASGKRGSREGDQDHQPAAPPELTEGAGQVALAARVSRRAFDGDILKARLDGFEGVAGLAARGQARGDVNYVRHGVTPRPGKHVGRGAAVVRATNGAARATRRNLESRPNGTRS